jgi:hypothetical protein
VNIAIQHGWEDRVDVKDARLVEMIRDEETDVGGVDVPLELVAVVAD